MNCRGNITNRKIFKAAGITFLIIYLCCLIYLTFFDGTYGRTIIHRSINMIPFKTIIQFITSSYNRDIIVTNIGGNITAFMPMGFLLPIASIRLKRFLKVIWIVLITTAAIEILQYITGVGAADIDDIILNTLGGILGYLIYLALKNIIKPA